MSRRARRRRDVDRVQRRRPAASRFLLDNGYVSLEEACLARDVTMEMLWAAILDEAGLPPCTVPAFAMMM